MGATNVPAGHWTGLARFEPKPPRDAITVAQMLSPPLRAALERVQEGGAVTFCQRSALRALHCMDEAGALTDFGRTVAGLA